ncbi:MAG: Cell division protein FtsZ [candidate division TM6 bacterium GW2011_GWE2_42_60]|nr:MAG: Cell division protein FtsZ [candidate division TM6 bacterium GW2011_GWE2_42_60]HBY05862.1 cell division protein FtsZ [Candidatus Dependentiae bacterium]
MIDFVERPENPVMPIARIKVIGIGGAGGNTINSMIASGFEHVEFIAANTDSQALEQSKAKHIIKLGSKLTKGLGSGANPEVGRRATEEDLDAICEHLDDADVVFLTAGLGGGTGSGGLPVVARALRERNILSIAVVTKPFGFEGKRRMKIAEDALQQIRSSVDSLIVIPNQKLLDFATEKLSLINAFEKINTFMTQFIRGISDIITKHGHINVDFADLQTIMRISGSAVMGSGRASGVNRAEEATLQAITSPFLEEQGVQGARGVLINITGNSELGLHEVSMAAQLIYDQADENANIVLGSVIDDSIGDDVIVTIIATGFGPQPEVAQPLPKVPSAPQATVQVKPTVIDPVKVDQAKNIPEKPITIIPEPEAHVFREPEITSPKIEALPQQIAPLHNQDDIDIPAILRKISQEQQKNT